MHKKYLIPTIIITSIQFIFILATIFVLSIMIASSADKVIVIDNDFMEPTVENGSAIFTKKYNQDKVYDIDNVVTYKHKDKTYLVRVVGYMYYQNGELKMSYGNSDLKEFADLGDARFSQYVVRYDSINHQYDVDSNDYSIKYSNGEINKNYDFYLGSEDITSIYKNHSMFVGNLIKFYNTPTHILFTLVLPIVAMLVYNTVLIYLGKKKVNNDGEIIIEDLSEEELRKRALSEYLKNERKKEEENNP